MMLLDIAVKSVLLGTLGWLAVCLLKRSSASARHLALFLTLLGLCLLPAISQFLPQWHVPFVRLQESPAIASGHIGSISVRAPAAPVRADVSQTRSAAEIVVIVWASVAGLLLLRMAFSLVRLGRLERSLPMADDPALQTLVTEHCRRSAKHVLLLEGLASEPPMTWGHSRPVLVLPADARTWPEERLHSVVLHELAHIERGDWMASMFSQLACAVYWFNPFAWIIRKRMEVESETAADDRVLNLGVSATQYASHLVEVSKELIKGRSSTGVALAMARPGKLDTRVRAILEDRRCRRSARGMLTLGLAATAVVVCVIGAAAPTVVRKALLAPPEVSVRVEPAAPAPGGPSFRASSNLGDPTESVAHDRENDARSSVASDSGTSSTGSSRETDVVAVAPPAAATMAPAPVVSAPQSHLGTPKPDPVVSNSSADSDGEPVDLGDVVADLKRSGVEVDQKTAAALKKLKGVSINTKEIIDAATGLGLSATRSAIESARKIGVREMAKALKDVQRATEELRRPPPKEPN